MKSKVSNWMKQFWSAVGFYKAPLLWQSCENLPLESLVQCMEGNYQPLIISGKPGNEEVRRAWRNVLYDFRGRSLKAIDNHILHLHASMEDIRHSMGITKEEMLFICSAEFDENKEEPESDLNLLGSELMIVLQFKDELCPIPRSVFELCLSRMVTRPGFKLEIKNFTVPEYLFALKLYFASIELGSMRW